MAFCKVPVFSLSACCGPPAEELFFFPPRRWATPLWRCRIDFRRISDLRRLNVLPFLFGKHFLFSAFFFFDTLVIPEGSPPTVLFSARSSLPPFSVEFPPFASPSQLFPPRLSCQPPVLPFFFPPSFLRLGVQIASAVKPSDRNLHRFSFGDF